MTQMDELLRIHIMTAVDITSANRETRHPDYALVALQQIVRNAVMHRFYEGTNAPVRVYWYADRVEVISPGGPFGQVTPDKLAACRHGCGPVALSSIGSPTPGRCAVPRSD